MSVFVCPEARRTLVRIASRLHQSTSTPSRFLPETRLQWAKCFSSQVTVPNISQIAWQTKHRPNSVARSKLFPGTHHRTIFSPKLLRDYEELPRDYKDQVGLKFSIEDLQEAETDIIFGEDLTPAAANYLLRVLHGRRVAGTLDDPSYSVHTAQFTTKQKAEALAYLRRKIPVEEIRNAGLRAEDELEQLEKDMAAKAQKEADPDSKDTNEQEIQVKPDPVYGQSHFDRIRARNQARNKAQEDALEEEKKAKLAEQEAAQAGPLTKQEEYARQIKNPKIVKYYEEAQSKMDAPPEMSAWRRILPSAALVLVTIGALASIAIVYEEPATKYRFLPDIPTSWATVGTLIGVNAIVYLGWRIPPLWKLFNKYMLVVVGTVRPVTMFTAMFSHQRLSHLFINMVPLWFVGNSLHEEIGRADFLALYLGCGAAGFLGSLVTYTLRGWLTVTALGASGATLGLCSAYFWEHRMDGFKIFGLPQDGVHGIVFLALIGAMQLTAFGRTATLKIDIASHLAGMAAGIAGIELINRSERMKGQKREGKSVFEMSLDLPPPQDTKEKQSWWKFW